MKLWGGRFAKTTDKDVNDFNSSISFDARMYKQDIEGSIAHVKMLGTCGIIGEDESALMQKALSEILEDIDQITFDADAEDIHMNIEKILTQRVGDVGKKLHTGRSRNDQVALDTRMYVKEQLQCITLMMTGLQNVLLNMAENNLDTIMPGYTHLQKAQPITLAHHLMAYFQMFTRDMERLRDCFGRTDTMPLGSGALAATTYPLDRTMVANQLNFEKITLNSLDAVSDRDFAIETSFVIAVIMMHLSRFCEELILWSSNEFSFVEMDDAYSTGSSIMPQKKNPDVAELIRGKTGRAYGNLMTLLTVMKALPLAYNKDMQEDKQAVFDSIDTIKLCLPVFTKMLETLTVNKQNMYKGAGEGFTNATDAADYLVKKGLAFRQAHEVIGRMVLYCIKNSKALHQLTMDEYKGFSDMFEPDVYEAISLDKCVQDRNIIGGPAKQAVKYSIQQGKSFLQDFKLSGN